MIGALACAWMVGQNQPKWVPKTDLLPPEFVQTAQFLLDHGLPDVRGYQLKMLAKPAYMVIDDGDTPTSNIVWVSPDGTTQVDAAGDIIPNRRVLRTALPSEGLPKVWTRQGNEWSFWDLKSFQSIQLILTAIHGEEKLVSKFIKTLPFYSGLETRLTDGAFRSFCSRQFARSLESFYDHDNKASIQGFSKVVKLTNEYSKLSEPWINATTDVRERKRYFEEFSSKSQSYLAQLNAETKSRTVWLSPESLKTWPVQRQVSQLIDQLSLLGVKDGLDRVYFGSSRTTDRLLELDIKAVPQLLEAFTHEDRHTRIRPIVFTAQMTIVEPWPVHRILRSMLSEMALRGPAGYMSDDELQAYWSKNLHKSLADRIYECLESDSEADVFPAAICAFENPTGIPSRHVQNASLMAPLRVRPEVLSSLIHRSPSVSELMFRHINRAPTKTEIRRTISEVISLARLAYRWNAKESLPTLVSACGKYILYAQLNGPGDNYEAAIFGELLDARRQLGDQTYLEDLESYAGALSHATNVRRFDSAFCVVDLAVTPEGQRIANRLFFKRPSSFNLDDCMRIDPSLISILGSPILNSAEGREQAIQYLKNELPIDTEKYQQRFGVTSHQSENGDTEWIPMRRFSNLRICDLAADALRNVVNCPAFNLEWSQQRRDQALPAMIRFVEGLKDKSLKFRWQFYW